MQTTKMQASNHFYALWGGVRFFFHRRTGTCGFGTFKHGIIYITIHNKILQ